MACRVRIFEFKLPDQNRTCLSLSFGSCLRSFDTAAFSPSRPSASTKSASVYHASIA